MNDNAKKWVEALRSGEYNQTTGALHNEGGHCCLGVACELYADDLTIQRAWVRPPQNSPREEFDGEGEILPRNVMKWLGLRTVTGEFGGSLELSQENDDGKSFEDIATIIESEPDGLFEEVSP